MKAGEVCINDIFNGARLIEVPFYQRAYVWKEEQWERFSEHMEEKYSRNGYIKLWIPNSPNEKALKELRNIIEHKTMLRKEFEKIYNEIENRKP